MRKRIAFFLSCLFVATLAFAQTTKVTGTVISVEDGEPIPGASVLIEGTKTGVVTNADGKFTMQVPTSSKYLEVSCSGMVRQRVRVKPVLNIALETDSKSMDEVMVVAYGTATKASFTGSAAVVGAEKIEALQSTNALDALTGHVAGVELYTLSGNPAANAPSIRIRGISSLSAGTSPLIVVDGTPYGGDMNTINTADVESMTVLKDAAATSLYGARGANGVIMITTKSGKRGAGAKVTLDAKWGSNSRARRHYKTVHSPAQYYEMYYSALSSYGINKLGMTASGANMWANQNMVAPMTDANGNRTSSYSYSLGVNTYDVPAGELMIGLNGKLNPNARLGNVVTYKGEDYLLYPDDWFDEAYSNGLRQEYNVNVSNATDKGSFYASFGYTNNEGITYNSSHESINGRLKADIQAKPWLKLGANMAYSHYNSKSMLEDGADNSSANIFAIATQIAPIYPLYWRNPDGSIKIDSKNGLKRYDWGDRGNGGAERPLLNGSNAIQSQQIDLNQWEGNSANVTGFAEVRFAKDFKFTSTNTMNLDESRSTDLTNPYYGNYSSQNGIIGKGHSRGWNYTFQQLLDWNHVFGKHDVGAMIGHEWYCARSYSLSASKYNMFDPTNLELAGAVADNNAASSSTGKYNNEAYFLRAQYNYAQKYFLFGSYRREASSRFSKEDGRWWGNFYSAGAAWVMSEESFIKKAKWIDFLKMKLSYGEQGNDNISSYLYTNRYTVGNSAGHAAVTQVTTKGNKDITWETVGELNGGLEFELFKNRLSGGVEYFWRKTSDMLYFFPMPRSSGFSGYYDNIGDMVNHGIEVELNANIFNTNNFSWDLGLNFTHYKNEVKSMPEENKTMTVKDFDGNEYRGYQSGNMFVGEGLSMGSYYIPMYAGVYNQNTWQNTTDAAYDPSKAGSSMWYYTKADGSKGMTTNYSDAPEYIIKNNILPKLFGGFNTSFMLYGFDLSLDFAYQLGGKVYDSDYARFMGSPTSDSRGGNFHADLLNAWSETNQGSNIPRLQYGDEYTAGLSTRFLTNASYLSLQNLSFGYTLPSNIVRKAKIDKVRIYMNASNVWLWSKRQGLDPRTAATDFSYGTSSASLYSTIRTISAGVNVTF